MDFNMNSYFLFQTHDFNDVMWIYVINMEV
jgi:hypothetical protein